MTVQANVSQDSKLYSEWFRSSYVTACSRLLLLMCQSQLSAGKDRRTFNAILSPSPHDGQFGLKQGITTMSVWVLALRHSSVWLLSVWVLALGHSTRNWYFWVYGYWVFECLAIECLSAGTQALDCLAIECLSVCTRVLYMASSASNRAGGGMPMAASRRWTSASIWSFIWFCIWS